MKRRLLIAAAAAFALAFLAALGLAKFSREPRVEGRRISEWIADYRKGSGEERVRAEAVLKRAGPEAAPYLAESLVQRQTVLDRVAAAVGPKIPEPVKRPLRKVFDPSKKIIDQHSAAQALQLMGTNAQTAIPVLGEMLKDRNLLLSVSASRALAAMGPGAVGPLVAALDHGSYEVRATACDALGQLGTNSAPAVPRLARIIRSEVGPVVGSAAFALARIGEPAIPALLNLLTETNAATRRQVVQTLGSLGINAGPAAEKLLELTKDPSPEIRATAIDSLGRIDPTSKKAARAAAEALEDDEAQVRGAALQLLRYRPRFVREKAPRIGEMLDDQSAAVQGYAALALSSAPDEAEPWRPKLNELAQASNAVLRASVAEALRIIDATRTQAAVQ